MIQRIQSLFLLAASACLLLLLHGGFKFGALDQDAPVVLEAAASTSFSDGKFTVDDYLILLLLTIAGGIIALATIFLFKKRKLQISLTKTFVFIVLLLNGLGFYLMYKDLGIVQENVEVGFAVKPGSFLPLIAIVLGYFAMRYIQKDEKLVKSMDRLR